MPFAPGCFWSPYSRPTFLSILPWSPFGKISQNGRFRCPSQICHNSAIRTLMHIWSRSLQQNLFLSLHFKSILIKSWCHLRQAVFEAPIAGLLFWAFCLGPPFGKISENGRFRCPCQICHNSAIQTLMELQFAAKCCPMFALQVHTN